MVGHWHSNIKNRGLSGHGDGRIPRKGTGLGPVVFYLLISFSFSNSFNFILVFFSHS